MKKVYWIIVIVILVIVILTYFYHSESKFINDKTYCEFDSDCHEYGCGGCSLGCENRYGSGLLYECSAICIRTEMTCKCERNKCMLRYSNVTSTCYDICNQWSNPNTYNCSSDDRHINFSSIWNELNCSLYLTCDCSPEEKKQIAITTEKSEYEQGETINADLSYDSEIYAWLSYEWSIQKWEDDSWNTILPKGDIYFHCANVPKCKDINLEEIEECPPIVLCERPAWYRLQTAIKMTWDQFYKTEEKTFQCKTDKIIGGIENWTCVIFDQVLPGKYKIIFEYTTAINQDDIFDRNVNIQYAEKEFTIK